MLGCEESCRHVTKVLFGLFRRFSVGEAPRKFAYIGDVTVAFLNLSNHYGHEKIARDRHHKLFLRPAVNPGTPVAPGVCCAAVLEWRCSSYHTSSCGWRPTASSPRATPSACARVRIGAVMTLETVPCSTIWTTYPLLCTRCFTSSAVLALSNVPTTTTYAVFRGGRARDVVGRAAAFATDGTTPATIV